MGVYLRVDEHRQPGVNTIAYYPLTQNANDYSGNNRNGTVTGTVNYVTDGTLTVAQNGTSSTYITLPNFTIDISHGWTVSVWWKFTSTANYAGMFEMYTSGRGSAIMRLQLNSNATKLNYHTDWATLTQNLSVTPTAWNNSIIVFGNGSITSYLNGVQVTSGTATGSKQIGIHQILGTYNTSPGTRRLSNYIIENKARTAQEVADYYNLTKSLYGIA